MADPPERFRHRSRSVWCRRRTSTAASIRRSAARSTRGVPIGHPGANDRIKHPVSNGNNDARRTQDAQKSAGRSLRYAPDHRPCGQNRDASGTELPTPARHGQNERVMALGRKNRGSSPAPTGGGEPWAVIASLIETCKLNDVDPPAYLADVLTRIVNGHPKSGSTSCCRGPTHVKTSRPWPENTAYSERSIRQRPLHGATRCRFPHATLEAKTGKRTPAKSLISLSRSGYAALSG